LREPGRVRDDAAPVDNRESGAGCVDIIVKSKNCEVPSKLKEEAVEKVEHATRFFDRLLGVEMVFTSESNPRIAHSAVVELTARTKGHHIRAEGAAEDHRAAVDEAVSKFERQLARYKARLVDRSQGRGAKAPPSAPGTLTDVPGEGSPAADGQPRIVRRKQFELPAMLPEDAALQLELLGHDFYVFINAGSGACNVVYRRRDGDLGLIEPAGSS
jgi:putative sigma-54 modulation protein